MSLKLNVNGHDHVFGSRLAPVELVEYGDYECSYCKKAFYIIKEAQQELGDDLKFVFRNFPLTDLHPHALHAAIAAEAAALQGKFWQMHDTLFENQSYLEDSDLVDYAGKLKLDIPQFEEDFEKDNVSMKINDDYDSGLKSNVQGTPSFFVNGKKFQGNWMGLELIDHMKSLIR